MKIHIFYSFQKGPWGGGNQFLKALKKEFERTSVYESDFNKADAVVFNSHHNLESCFQIKRKYPNKIIMYRLDGPISSVRGKDKEIDKIIRLFNKLFVDGIIFQSSWCKKQNKKLFGISSKYEIVVHNAPDNKIFNNRTGKGMVIGITAKGWRAIKDTTGFVVRPSMWESYVYGQRRAA